MSIVDWALIGVLLAVIAIGAYLLVFPSPRLHDQCLTNGYPQYQFTYTGEVYCIRRINGTDEVKPLDEIMKEKGE